MRDQFDDKLEAAIDQAGRLLVFDKAAERGLMALFMTKEDWWGVVNEIKETGDTV